MWNFKKWYMGFPGAPVVCFHGRGHRFDPRLGMSTCYEAQQQQKKYKNSTNEPIYKSEIITEVEDKHSCQGESRVGE